MPSALFQIDPGTGTYGGSGVAQDAAAAVTVNCRITDLSGVDSIAWTLFGTHGITAPTITLSGNPSGQIASFTLGTAVANTDGQAFGIELRVNGGTSHRDLTGRTQTSAVYVLNTLGVRPAFIGETFEGDATYAIVPRMNQLLAGRMSSLGDYKLSVRAATAVALPAYTRTVNVITATANGALAAIDGVTMAVTEELLLQNGASGVDNGIYVITTFGDGSNPYVLTRRSDFDSDTEVTAGALIPVAEGTTYGDRIRQLTTNDPIVINTTALTFASGGGGDVTGPATSTDNAIARFDGTTGKVLQNSLITISDSDDLVLLSANDAATPSLAFGDGDTGFYENAANSISVAIAGLQRWIFVGASFQSLNAAGPVLRDIAASATAPTLIPDQSDLNTGVGQVDVDQLSLIAGGVEGIRISTLDVVVNDAGADIDFRVATDNDAFTLFVNGGTDNIGIGTFGPTAKLHVDQASTTGARPTLFLDQADISEEMIEFNTTIGTGNAIEAVGAKTLTTTHFIKVTLPGGITRYIPCGTIA